MVNRPTEQSDESPSPSAGEPAPDGGTSAAETEDAPDDPFASPDPSMESPPAEDGGPDDSEPDGSEPDEERFEPRDPDAVAEDIHVGNERLETLAGIAQSRTIDTLDEIDEEAFFTAADGGDTVTTRYDFEQAVPDEMKPELEEIDRYWVNKPYAFISLLRSDDDNEVKYYAVEPHLTPIEEDFLAYLSEKIRDEVTRGGLDDVPREQPSIVDRRERIERQTYDLLEEFQLYSDSPGVVTKLYRGLLEIIPTTTPPEPETEDLRLDISARPMAARDDEQAAELTRYQVEKLLYYLKRDFVGYEKIDPIKHDINVEDISCNGYNRRVFVYHIEHEQIITNITHSRDELDDFVVKLAQRSGKGISKRQPQVDATLPDGSRAQLTLGKEVSDHGTNYTIRQFKDVPFTPVDLINWNTFALDQMAFLWLCIENEKSLIFAGGTASGKTTSLNAVSLFIPSETKIVSIEDTREVELPQRNWVASVTRPSFTADDKGDVDEFDLLEAALRQRPDYIVMGEIRGEEGRTAFQVMSTGHTTYTTFHADSVGEVIKRFTTDPINVSKTMFTALDLVSIQTQTRIEGRKVRRSKTITEINDYSPENDEINVNDVYQWQAETDTFMRTGNSAVLDEIAFDRGWSDRRLDEEIRKRQVVLAYLIANDLNTYTQVAATIQAFISDPDSILALIARDELAAELENLQKMESILIDVDAEDEELVPRPNPGPETSQEVAGILDDARPMLSEYAEESTAPLTDIIGEAEEAAVESDDITVDEGIQDEREALEELAGVSFGDDSDDGADTDGSDDSPTEDDPAVDEAPTSETAPSVTESVDDEPTGIDDSVQTSDSTPVVENPLDSSDAPLFGDSTEDSTGGDDSDGADEDAADADGNTTDADEDATGAEGESTADDETGTGNGDDVE